MSTRYVFEIKRAGNVEAMHYTKFESPNIKDGVSILLSTFEQMIFVHSSVIFGTRRVLFFMILILIVVFEWSESSVLRLCS